MRTSSSSTSVTKLLPTFASHSTATLVSLNPIVAFRTLLKLSTIHKLYELLIVFIETVIYSVFSTSHSCVILASAFQAVMLMAGRTSIVIENFIEFKGSCAASGWAPGHILGIFFNIFVERKLLIFLSCVSIDIVKNIISR